MAAVNDGFERVDINEHIALEISYRQHISYADFNNGRAAVRAWRLVSLNSLAHAGYAVEFSLAALGEKFAENCAVGVEVITQDTSFEHLQNWKLLPNPFLAISDSLTGHLTVSVSQDGDTKGLATFEVVLAPMSVWLWSDINDLSDLGGLAAFSVPNNEAVAGILTSARTLGNALTGGSETLGYQFDMMLPPEQALAAKRGEIASLYEVVRSLELDYSNPPAKYTSASQRIRTPKEVLESKSATCLDTTLLFSSLLEAMGYHPLLAVVPGHAFVGVWLLNGHSIDSLVEPATKNSLALQDTMLFFETTTACKPGTDFETAVSAASKKLNEALLLASEGDEAAEGYRLIDVTGLKMSGFVKPIPDRKISVDGSVTIVESTFVANFGSKISELPNDNPALRQVKDDSPARIKVWKESLLDLTFFNPLLEMTRGSGQIKKGGFKILAPTKGPGVIEDLLQSRDKSNRPLSLGLLPYLMQVGEDSASQRDFTEATFRGVASQGDMQKTVDLAFDAHSHLTTNIPEKEFSKRLKALARAARANLDETGVNSLYITFGSLTWDRLTGASRATATSPLLLLPVSIIPINKGQSFQIYLDETTAIATNETLAIKLLNDYGIDLPKLRNPDEDASGFDVPGLIKHVRETLAASKYKSWRVDDDCTIGFYDFSTYHQWKDLNDNWRLLNESPLVNHLISKSHLEFDDPAMAEAVEYDLDLEASKVPVETDESQIRAIARSLNGESFVIQGPPGTGKSQTITNLLARNLQEGRRVLFVCEKAAALEVVKNRLQSVGLGEFVLDLHGTKTKPAEVRARLMAALEASPEADITGLESAKYDHDMALNALKKYPARIHTPDTDFGCSVYEARNRYLAIASDVDLPIDRTLLRTMKSAERDAFAHTLLSLKDDGEIAGNAKKNIWSLSNLYQKDIDLALKDEILAALRNLESAQADLKNAPAAQRLVNQVKEIDDFTGLSSIKSGQVVTGAAVDSILSPATATQIDRALKSLKELKSKNAEAPISNESTFLADIDKLRSLAFEASQANFFTRGKKQEALIFALRPYVSTEQVLTRENAPLVLEKLASLKDFASKTASNVRDIEAISVQSSWNPFSNEDLEWFESEVAKVNSLKNYLDSISEESRSTVRSLLVEGQVSAIDAISTYSTSAVKFFKLLKVDDASLQMWLNGRTLIEAMADSLARWLENATEADLNGLSRWARLIGLLAPLRDSKQLLAYEAILLGRIDFADAARAFDRSYYKLVFDKLLDDNELGNFEGKSFDRSIATFGEAAHKLRGFNRASMAQDIVENRTFDGRAGVGKAGQLKSELQKRNNTLSVRQLLKRYWDTVTEITPCVAASPDSVARFLDVNHARFDLVVFDEASQIRVATAIGALGRAKSAIVVGDSKQMPPTAFFATQYAAEEDMFDAEAELPTQDEESILSEAVRAQIPSTMLTWHYRSQDETLIAFSNKEYYEGRLSSFPSPREAATSHGVQLREVEDGFYIRSTKSTDLASIVTGLKGDKNQKHRFGALTSSDLQNTNPSEAVAVVDEIRRRFSEPGADKISLGVVTMNEAQKKLIELLLDDVDIPLLQTARNSGTNPDYLFVRALEKVQGDERDVIIMSIGFSKDASGRVPLNFGPLSRAGGERRLNVAITRARQQVLVFSSFRAQDLDLKETSAKGMHDLKGYLKMAAEGPEAAGIANGGRVRLGDRHRHDIAKALADRGFRVSEDVGLSGFRVDIAVADPKDPSKRLMAIMLDGRDWNSRQTASDREVLPVLMLQESMGWPVVERIWLPTWMRDRNGEIDRVVGVIEQAQAERESIKKVFNLQPHSPILKAQVIQEDEAEQPLEQSTSLGQAFSSGNSVPSEVTIDTGLRTRSKAQLGVNVSDIQEYREFLTKAIGARTDLNYLSDSGVRKAISDLADSITQYEGPVSAWRFSTLVAKSFGLSSVKSEKSEAIASIPSTSHFARDSEGFLYPKGVKPNGFADWKRQADGEGRDLSDISLQEICNSMRDLCSRVHGMEQSELFKQTSLAFGRSRVGAVAEVRLQSALKLGLKRGILRLDDGLIEAA